MKPLHESLSKVDSKLQEVEKERAGSHATLAEQIRLLLGTTTNLEKALRTPNVRGGWGEVQLRRVVEMAGMLEHCHFNEKESAVSDDGRLVPDLVIKLPGANMSSSTPRCRISRTERPSKQRTKRFARPGSGTTRNRFENT